MKTLFLTMKKDFRLKKDILNLDTQIYLIELIENIIPVVMCFFFFHFMPIYKYMQFIYIYYINFNLANKVNLELYVVVFYLNILIQLV